MARIRTIKPEFFRHAGLFDLEQETGLPVRVAFAGLWTAADREGRFAWKPRELKLDCLPFDLVDFSRVLDALATRGHIVKYIVDGVAFGFIPSWNEHQVINNRETPSSLPEPTETSIAATTCTRDARVTDASATPLVHAQGEGKGKEGKGKGRDVAPATRVADAKPPAPTAGTWTAYCDAYRERYGVDPVRNAKVNGQVAQFVGRLGADSPQVAAFFVGLQDQFYVKQMHPVDLLLRDAEKLRTQWATGRRAPPAAPPPPATGWQAEQGERMRGFAGPAAARRATAETIDLETINGTPRIVG